eukprot:420051_1
MVLGILRRSVLGGNSGPSNTSLKDSLQDDSDKPKLILKKKAMEIAFDVTLLVFGEVGSYFDYQKFFYQFTTTFAREVVIKESANNKSKLKQFFGWKRNLRLFCEELIQFLSNRLA